MCGAVPAVWRCSVDIVKGMIIQCTLTSISTSFHLNKGLEYFKKISCITVLNVSLSQFWDWILRWGELDSVDSFFLFQGSGKRTFWDPDSTSFMVFDCRKRLFAPAIYVCMCVCFSKNALSKKFFAYVFILWTEAYVHLVCWDLSTDFHNPHLFPHQPS